MYGQIIAQAIMTDDPEERQRCEDKCTLLGAIQRQVFCPETGHALDIGSAVMVELDLGPHAPACDRWRFHGPCDPSAIDTLEGIKRNLESRLEIDPVASEMGVTVRILNGAEL